MISRPLNVLLVEDSADDEARLRTMLAEAQQTRFEVECAERLSASSQRLRQGDIDAVLLDLSLPDSQGLETFRETRLCAPAVPIVVLTGTDDRDSGERAVREGAQGCLVKTRVDPRELEHAVCRAVEQTHDGRAPAVPEDLARSQKTLTEQTPLLESVLNSIADGVIVVDEQGRCLLFNPVAEEILGFSRPESPHYEWPQQYGIFMADGTTPFPLDHLPLARARRGEIVREEEVFIRVPGREKGVWVSTNASPLQDAEGRIRGGVAVFRDITERREAEQNRSRLAAVVEASEDAIVTARSDGTIEHWNTGAEHIFGYTAEEIIGHNVSVLIPPERHNEREEVLNTVMEGNKVQNFETVRLRKDGRLIDISLSASPLRNERGEPTFLTVIARDITGRLQREREIRELNTRLEQHVQERTKELDAANRELESFSYSVSHDLRAPLRVIDGFSAALQEDCSEQLDEQGRHYIQRIRAGVQRMGQLISAMLNLSRLTRTELRKQTVDLSSLAETILDDLLAENPTRRIEARVAEGVNAEGDPQLLEIVLRNLLGNAWKFTSGRSPAEIAFGVQRDDDRTVYFVRDNGTGFDMRYADKLFVPFQRLHGQSEFEGVGIGLATVQRIIHRHGGRIWAEAEEDRGATFFFTLQKGSSAPRRRIGQDPSGSNED